jgi:hypothetical protein
MPLYFFNLKNEAGRTVDPDGTILADDEAAREHARLVACELMRNHKPSTRSWRLEVCDHQRGRCFDVLFAAVDDAITRFAPELRTSIVEGHAKVGSLYDAIHDVKCSLHQLKATMARSERSPYLAALNGVRV